MKAVLKTFNSAFLKKWNSRWTISFQAALGIVVGNPKCNNHYDIQMGREYVLNVLNYERIETTDTGDYLLCIGGVYKLRNFEIFEGTRLFLEIQHFYWVNFNAILYRLFTQPCIKVNFDDPCLPIRCAQFWDKINFNSSLFIPLPILLL